MRSRLLCFDCQSQASEVAHKQAPRFLLHIQVMRPQLCPPQKQSTITLLSGAAACLRAPLPHLYTCMRGWAQGQKQAARASHVIGRSCVQEASRA